MDRQYLSLFYQVSGHGVFLNYDKAFLARSSLARVIHSICSPPWLQELRLQADLFQAWLP